MIFFDTEGVGKTGPLVTIQYSYGPNSASVFIQIWKRPLKEFLIRCEDFCNYEEGICGFNLTHDWFCINKWYNIISQLTTQELELIPYYPLENDQYLDIEYEETQDGYWHKNLIRRIEEIEREGPKSQDRCLKPQRAIDLMLIARAGKYQYLAKHKPITIRKVPVQALTYLLSKFETSRNAFAKECNITGDSQESRGYLERIKLPDGVQVRARISEKRSYQRKDVKDIVIEFTNQSTSLKALTAIIMNKPEIKEQTFDREVLQGRALPYKDCPDWKPWGVPFSSALRKLVVWLGEERATRYAIQDVHYTIALFKVLYPLWSEGQSCDRSIDSELACLIGAMQWKGFSVNIPQCEELMKKYEVEQYEAPTAPAAVMTYLQQYLNTTEQLVLQNTKKTTLEELVRWENHPVQAAIKKVQTARRAQRRLNLLKKLIASGRFTFAMKVLGALSSRMSGGSEVEDTNKEGKLNAQGIPREKEFRSLFDLAFDNEDEYLEGGDFDAFEVSIAEAVYNDPQLTADLKECEEQGAKFHSITGSVFYKCSREEIFASKATLDDKYVRSKNGFFAFLYGAHIHKLSQVLNLSEEDTERAIERIKYRYPQIAKHRKQLEQQYCPLRQKKNMYGEGGEVEWNEPPQYIDTITNFKRYFTLEYAILRGIYDLASELPDEINEIKGNIRRTNREQTIGNATRSALYSACFVLQNYIFRAAANHEIQSPGAQITKFIQGRLWEMQPAGINDWRVRILNSHDEVMTVVDQAYHIANGAQIIINEALYELKDKVTFIKMDWKNNLKNWGEKG